MKLFIFDVETTGLDPTKHSITQLGYIRREGSRRIETLLTIKPLPGSDINLSALDATNQSFDAIMSATAPEIAYKRLLDELGSWVDKFNKTDKFIPVGYNVRFDLDFLRNFFYRVDHVNGKYFGSWFSTGAIDLFSLVALKLGDSILDLPNNKLSTIAEAFGIKVSQQQIHSALYDALLTEEIFNKLTEGVLQ